MKIVAGMGNLENYAEYVKAGADELFCGYMPFDWSEKYGMLRPINRREVRYSHVQIGSFEELRILRKRIEVYGVPVTLAFNSLFYTPEQYDDLTEILQKCIDIGYESFIVADPALFFHIKQQKMKCSLHISGEMAEMNSLFLREIAPLGVKRVIFHRKTDLANMKKCILDLEKGNNKGEQSIPEYEAFFLNEMCHYTGAFCNSLHCDEMGHLCRVPYELGVYGKAGNASENGDRNQGLEKTDTIRISKQSRIREEDGKLQPVEERFFPEVQGYLPGQTGCGFCALWKLRDAGVTHLKIVGRGNSAENMIQDIQAAKMAIEILQQGENEVDYLREMKKQIFPEGCSQVCYYR